MRLSDLAGLIERVESAPGPDRNLDAEIHVTLCQPQPIKGDETRRYRLPHVSLDEMDQCAPGHYWYCQRSGKSLHSAPPYTASLDAAIKLVDSALPQWGWCINDYRTGDADAFLHPPRPSDGSIEHASAGTPPLALCATSVRAWAQQVTVTAQDGGS